MNAKKKCSARVIGTSHGITLSKPVHNHDQMDFPEPKRRSKISKNSVSIFLE